MADTLEGLYDRDMDPEDRNPRARRLVAAGAAGVCVGALAFLGDGLRGVVAAVFLGVVSSASTWMLAASLWGYRAAFWRVAAGAGAVFGAGLTTTYYLLRWLLLRPWMIGETGEVGWSASAAPKFLLVAGGWILATTCGAAVLAALVSRIPSRPGTQRDVWLAIWLALCAAPALVSLCDWAPAAVASWSATDWGATVDTGAVFLAVSALAALVVVLFVLGWWVPRTAGLTSPVRFVVTATVAMAALVLAFWFGTHMFFQLVHAI